MDKYGLIGYPLGHSFSISYFNQRFADEGINAKYINFEIPSIDELPEVLAKNPELKGLNVTIPYKEKVFDFLDSVSPEARAIGAVNVIKITHDGSKISLKGYNSDVIGFTQSIEPMLDKKWQIVNCTPLGMFPNTEVCPDLPYEAMDHHTILYDLIYNPDQTLFMRRGAEYGADVKNGLEMLLLQAFASWEFWNDER